MSASVDAIGAIKVKFGPTTAAFRGEAKLDYDHDAHRCRIEGRGIDQRGASRALANGEVLAAAATHGLKVEIVPSLEELAAGRVKTSRVRPVEVQDLLGRSAVEIDSAGSRQALAGRVVLVTGAGGSIGSELCRQIAALNPERLLLVEQSEAALFLIEQEINEKGFGGTITPLAGETANLDSITAVVIGGTSLFGGRGTIIGSVLGAIIVGVFRFGLSLSKVDVLWQDFTVGILIIAAVAIDQWIRKASN